MGRRGAEGIFCIIRRGHYSGLEGGTQRRDISALQGWDIYCVIEGNIGTGCGFGVEGGGPKKHG